MSFHVWDILSVGAILVIALIFLYKNYRKTSGCATLCSSCSGGACSSKSFVKDKKVIVFTPKHN